MLKYLVLWYLVGWLNLALILYFASRKKDEGITIIVDDVIQGLVWAAAGGILVVPVLFYFYEDFIQPKFPKIDPNKVLYRSKRARSRHILFGDDKKK